MEFGKIFDKMIDDKFYNSLKEQIKKLDEKANKTLSYDKKIKYTEQALELSLKLYEHSKSNGYSDFLIQKFDFDSDEYEVKKHKDSLESYKIYNIYQQALALEKDKKLNEALKIHLHILENFIPKGTTYYDRPLMLLERLKRYEDAIKICDLAIKNQQQYNLHFSREEFENDKTRLLKKLNKSS